MWRNAHDTYLEERVLSADPVELIELLHQAAITAVGDARRHLAEGRILARAKSISKACEILLELAYMHRRLVEANSRQSDQPLAEVARLLATLMEGWSGANAASRRIAPRETPWMQTDSREPELAHASGSWSF